MIISFPYFFSKYLGYLISWVFPVNVLHASSSTKLQVQVEPKWPVPIHTDNHPLRAPTSLLFFLGALSSTMEIAESKDYWTQLFQGFSTLRCKHTDKKLIRILSNIFNKGQFWERFYKVPQRVPRWIEPQLATVITYFLSLPLLLALAFWGYLPGMLPALESLSQHLPQELKYIP